MSAVTSGATASGGIMDAANFIDRINAQSAANSAASAEQAKITRDWQEQQNAKAMAFNQMEAAKNRNWQEYMSNTAHQREVADLKAAGLNPILSVNGGNGAAVTSGATASGVSSSGATGQVDTSANSAIVSLLSAVYNRSTQLEAANINARTQEAVAKQYTEMSKIVADIGLEGTKFSAGASALGTKYATDHSKFGAIISFLEGFFGKDPSGSGKDVRESVNDSEWSKLIQHPVKSSDSKPSLGSAITGYDKDGNSTTSRTYMRDELVRILKEIFS